MVIRAGVKRGEQPAWIVSDALRTRVKPLSPRKQRRPGCPGRRHPRRAVESYDRAGADHPLATNRLPSRARVKARHPWLARRPTCRLVAPGIPDVKDPTRTTGTRGQLLRAGIVDEVRIHAVPVLLGAGARLLDDAGGRIRPQPTSMVQGPKATHLRYTWSRHRKTPPRTAFRVQPPRRSEPKLHRLPSGSRAL
jgi:hypothetical protein